MFRNLLWSIKEKIVGKWEDEAYEIKSTFLESILGREHELVMHAVIPFAVGGTLDLYY